MPAASIEASEPMETVRVLTLNMWGEQPPMAKRMELIVKGINELAPDVIALQEVREIVGQLPNQAETLAERTGYKAVFAPATKWGGGTEGVAILSRLPI